MMSKRRLEDMTLEELWELFPIDLVEYNPAWVGQAEREIELLSEILGEFHPTIHHIGSTAIGGIRSKATVDILVEIPQELEWRVVKDVMTRNGYICMAETERRLSFNKGYTPSGYAPEVYHIHIHRRGDRDEVVFRDYLRAHREAAREYEALKLSLLPLHRHNRDGYTEAKSDFVQDILGRAMFELKS